MATKRKIRTRGQIPEDALMKPEHEWQKTFDGINDGICLLSVDQKIFRCNRSMATIFGRKREEMVGKYCFEVVHGTKEPVPDCPITRMRKSLMRETMDLERNGRRLEVTVDPMLDDAGELAGILHIVRDITERKKIEEELRESEKRYRSIVEHANDAFYIHDFKGKILDCNDNACRMLGWSREELLGAHLNRIDSPRERELMPKRLAENVKKGYLVFDGEHVRKDGSHVMINVSSRVVSREGDGIVQSFVRDISERKKTEEALRESEEKYRTLAESSPEMIYLVDGQGFVRYVNKAALAIFKGGRESVVGKHLRDLYPPPIAEQHLKAIRGVIATGSQFTTEMLEEFPAGKCWIDARLSPVRDSSGAIVGVLGLSANITERKKMEERMARDEKLESLRIFAGGIAHDFNNLLTGIFGNIDLARSELPEQAEALKFLNNSFLAFDRAKQLAHQLLTFAKGGAPQKKPLLLPEAIRNIGMLALSGSNVKGEFRFSEGLWPVEADEGQLSQVMSNLIINAWQAMPQGGTVTVSAENRTLEAGSLGALPAGRYVAVSVKDQGVGIPEKIIDKIFDPFFTTKQQGSGLGLATCYSIVSRHGGYIDVVSEPGEGAVFTIWLPASEQAVDAAESYLDIKELRGSGRILVMDDERLIRAIAHDMLTWAGYEADMAVNGKEVVEKYSAALDKGKKFDAVILDLTVPGGMGGEQTLRELKKIDPEVAAVVSSGYADNTVLAHFAEHGFAAMVPKPYSLRELLTTVKMVLEKKKNRG